MSARAFVLPVFVPHLGCPHHCVFCNQSRISGEEKPADAEAVRALLQEAGADPTKERQLAFYGGSFTAIPVREQTALLQAAHEGIERGIIASIRLSTRPDAIDLDVLQRLRAYGVRTVELGAQSMDDEVLRLSGRGHSAADVRRAARMLSDAGFELILQMMTGLPGDTEEKSLNTAREFISLHPDGVRIYPTVVVRDTALYALWKRGEYREHSVEDALRVCAKLLPLFEEAGIPVIRLGLNPTEELSGGAAVAGAYHPAFGELVRSRILLERAEKLLTGVKPGSRVLFSVPQRQLSQFLGQHRQNVAVLKSRFALEELRVEADPANSGEIRWISVENPDK